MMSALADFTAHLLVENGAVVEPMGDGLEVLLPADVARALEIPEHANLSFLGGRGEGFSVSYDSEILRRMAGLMGDRGKFAAVALGPSSVKLEKLEDGWVTNWFSRTQCSMLKIRRRNPSLISWATLNILPAPMTARKASLAVWSTNSISRRKKRRRSYLMSSLMKLKSRPGKPSEKAAIKC